MYAAGLAAQGRWLGSVEIAKANGSGLVVAGGCKTLQHQLE
jgi:hypothetical protein